MARELTTIQTIREAAGRIAPFIHRTPILTFSAIDTLLGATVFLKCENLQKVGAFKARGATNAVVLLDNHERQRGVATHSSGNHAQALAYAAQQHNIACTVVMPDTSPEIKVRATKGYGADIVFCENTLAARENTLANIVNASNAVVVHPYDNENVIAGQGTTVLELLSDIPDLDVVIAPVGGGGLMSGTAIATRALSPSVEVLGAEPVLAADAKGSLETGILQAPFPPKTIADGLRTALSERTFSYLQKNGVKVITAEELTIMQAMEIFTTRAKLVVEASAAVPLAALLEHPHLVKGKRIGMILSGGNRHITATM